MLCYKKEKNLQINNTVIIMKFEKAFEQFHEFNCIPKAD